MTHGRQAANLGTLVLLALAALAATGEPRMTDLPAPAWAAVGVIGGALISQMGGLIGAVLGRRPTRSDSAKADVALGDGIRQDAVYWQGRAHDADAENERLRALLRESHQREERLLRVNDTVMVASAKTRNEVSRAIGPGDATPTAG